MNYQVTKPVGDIAVEMPASIPYFEDKGIDYCCGGKRTLAEACEKAGADSGEVIQALEAMARTGSEKGPETWPSLGALIQHLLDKHHVYTREQLALVDRLGSKVLQVHGSNHPELAGIFGLFEQMAEELFEHLIKEEQVAFPYLMTLEDQAGTLMFPFETFQAGPERVLMADHEAVGTQLAELRRLTQDYLAPAGACVTYRAFYQGLKDLELDLHRHIHLENNVLFPMAEKRVLAQSGAGT
jgi:regulator of cell morphogenesis and NO signaling